MDNYSKIYWLTRLDYIQGFCIFFVILSAVTLIFWHIIMGVECYDSDDRKKYNEDFGIIKKFAFIGLLITSVLLVFVPSKNDMILIYAGGKTMDYVQKDTSLQKIPYQATKVISEYLDKSISELKEKD